MSEIKRLAHSSVLIKADGKYIYIDPYSPDPLSKEIEDFYRDPYKADILLITHHHHDHCDPETIEKLLDEETEIIASEKCEEKIDQEFTSLQPDEEITIDGINIKATHAYNMKRKRDSGEPFHPKGECLGYLITVDGKTIYHPGDTEHIPEMEDLRGIDITFLPIDGTYTMDIEEAVQAAKTIGAEKAIPFHERDADLGIFKRKLESDSDIDAIILGEGEILEF